MSRDTSTVCLFDVDGTLTPARKKISPEMSETLAWLRERTLVAVVSGSDLSKIAEQLGETPDHVAQDFDFVFSENGLVAHKNGSLISKESLVKHLGNDLLQEFINFALQKLSEIKLPCKRGNFIEFRSGMINVCPVGRSCSQAERDEFSEYDKKHNVRQNLVAAFKKQFPNSGLCFAIGGQISIDVFPEGWDKRFCLRHLEHIKTIHFYGDRTEKGGNDHEIFEDSRTIGHTVTSPEDTIKQLKQMFA